MLVGCVLGCCRLPWGLLANCVQLQLSHTHAGLAVLACLPPCQFVWPQIEHEVDLHCNTYVSMNWLFLI